MPPRPRNPNTPGAPKLGAKDAVTLPKAGANRGQQTVAMLKDATGLELDQATAAAMVTEVRSAVPGLAGMEPDAARAAVIKAVQAKGPDYWVQWLAQRQGAAPKASPAKPSPAPEPSAEALDAAVTGGDVPSEPAPARPASQGRPAANQVSPKQAAAIRQWLLKQEMPADKVAAMKDEELPEQMASLQKSIADQKRQQAAKPQAKASRGRPAAEKPQGKPGRGRGRPAGAAVTTDDEGVVNTVSDIPASKAELGNLSADQLEKLLLEARVREATEGSRINVGRGPVGPLPTFDTPPAGLGIGADELVVNKFGGSQTTPSGAAPPPPPPPPPPGGGGPPDPPNTPPDEPRKKGFFYNPFGTTTVQMGGQDVEVDNIGRKVARYLPATLGAGAVVASPFVAWRMMSGGGGSAIPPDEREAIRQRAIMARQFKQQLFGTYDEPPTSVPMAPPDMQAPPENTIRAFQRGVR